ncbi:MAG: HpcH/HpaI aldolase family protein [Chloroflexota bacterium]
MKNRLRRRFREGQTAYGLWVTLESPSITEMAAEMGLDWVCIDTEHGHLDYKEVLEHTRAAASNDTAVIVRVPDIGQDLIKRVLDIGVEGVMLPLVRSAADLALGMRYAQYPPQGVRGIGGERAVRWGLRYQEYLESANTEVMVMPLIETADAVAAINEILAVPGLEAIFFGPADLSATYGYLGAWEGPGVAERILSMKDQAGRAGIATGVVSTSSEDALQRRNQGFSMVGLGSDAGLLIRQAGGLLKKLRDQAVEHDWF